MERRRRGCELDSDKMDAVPFQCAQRYALGSKVVHKSTRKETRRPNPDCCIILNNRAGHYKSCRHLVQQLEQCSRRFSYAGLDILMAVVILVAVEIRSTMET